MPKVTYIEYSGREHRVEVPLGLSVMRGAIDNDIPGIDADCGGECACAINVHPHMQRIDRPHRHQRIGQHPACAYSPSRTLTLRIAPSIGALTTVLSRSTLAWSSVAFAWPSEDAGNAELRSEFLCRHQSFLSEEVIIADRRGTAPSGNTARPTGNDRDGRAPLEQACPST